MASFGQVREWQPEPLLLDGRRVPLRQITGGDWDTVHVFPGGTLRESVQERVGATIDIPYIYQNEGGGLMVFVKQGTVQRAVALLPWPFDGNLRTFGPNVTATPMPSSNSGWLRLTEQPGP